MLEALRTVLLPHSRPLLRSPLLLLCGLYACGSTPSPDDAAATTGVSGAANAAVGTPVSSTSGSPGNTANSNAATTGGATTGGATTGGATTGAGSGGAAAAVATNGAVTTTATGDSSSTTTTTTTTTNAATTDGTSSGAVTTDSVSSGGAASNGTTTDGTATTGGNGSTTPVGRYGQLRVVENQLSDASGAPVTLRGQGFGWDNWWPQYYNANVVAWLRQDWCVDVVRPAMGIEPEGAYLENPSASRGRMQAVVEAAIAEEVYVIIDWHAHNRHESEAVAFFSDMAQAYGSHANVIYEVYNEPEEETWPQVKAYAEAVIAAIRQHDPDNIVIVGSPEWDQRIDLVAADPITSDANVVYSVHFYADAHGQWLRTRATAAKAAGIPLIVSESGGSEASGQGANNYSEWQAWFDFLEGNQISWLNYSVSDKQDETISVLEPGASANGGWGASELTETGEYIREVLRSHCQ